MHRHRGKKNLKGLAFSKRPAYVSRVTELGASNSERNSCPLRPGTRTNPWLGLGSPKQLSRPPRPLGRRPPSRRDRGGRAEAHSPPPAFASSAGNAPPPARKHLWLHEARAAPSPSARRTHAHTHAALRRRRSTTGCEASHRARPSFPRSLLTNRTHTPQPAPGCVAHTHTQWVAPRSWPGARRLPRPQRNACGTRFSAFATPPHHAHTRSLAAAHGPHPAPHMAASYPSRLGGLHLFRSEWPL